MFLSRLELDPAHPQARRDLSDPYEMHRTLVRAYAPDPKSPPTRFLWRLEPSPVTRPSAVLLIQSETPADWTPIESLDGYARDIRANKPLELARLVRPGARYRFRLRANPTVTRDGKRHGLDREEEQLDWMSRQGAKWGFSLVGCVRGGSEQIRSRQGSTGRRITLRAVLFEGALETTDAERLRAAVQSGLGHGKAWGLGLLSLARIAI
jgi:CRISPR system Cascade subunit CasE